MRRRNLLFNRTGLFILVCALFLLVRMESDMILSDLINKISSLSGYISSRKEDGITTRGIINQYMPVVGYVDSHYIETDYLTDPSYDFETRIEYIDLDETSNIQEENTEEETQREKCRETGSNSAVFSFLPPVSGLFQWRWPVPTLWKGMCIGWDTCLILL